MKCPKCGSEIQEGKKFCTNCGYDTNGKKKILGKLIACLSVLIVLVVIVSSIVIAIKYNNYKKDLSVTQSAQINLAIFSLNQGLSMGTTIMGRNYYNTDDVIENGILKRLSIANQWSDAIELPNGTHIEFNKLRENCPNSARGNIKDNACAEIYITTGIPFMGNIKFKQDQKKVKVYLFKNEISSEVQEIDNQSEQEISTAQNNKSDTNSADILDEIERYQTKYWEIIKRNNTLVNLEPDIGAANDLEELNSLFAELKNKIDSSKYFTEYQKNKKDFSQSLDTIDIANRYYEAVDKLLNKVYKAVKEQLSEDDFEQLKLSQRKWLKDLQSYQNQKFYELYEYENKEDADIVKIYSEINMKEFRTLLLMLYL